MKPPSAPLIVELLKQEQSLKMSAHEQQELTWPVRRYSQHRVSFSDVENVCRDIASYLNRANRRDAVQQGLLSSLKASGQLLWELLLTRSLKDRLKSTDCRDLVLLIDEELISIPWELLYDGADFLCLKFNLGRVLRARQEEDRPRYRGQAARSGVARLRMLILANPTSDLESAYQEGLTIKNKFDSRREKLSIDFKSTRIDTLYVKKNLREYDLVHYAGHCECHPGQLERTGWTLSDGVFSAQDILGMSEEVSFPRMVFSNACQSARIEPESPDLDSQQRAYSLASAFLFSGVRHYIGPLHRIEDPVSLSFAKEFYRQLSKGASVGEAMRLSRLRLSREYGLQSVFWALYLLYGDPTHVLFARGHGMAAAGHLRQPEAGGAARSRPRELLSVLAGHGRTLAWTAGIAVLVIAVTATLAIVRPSDQLLVMRGRSLLRHGENQALVAFAAGELSRRPQALELYVLAAEAYERQGMREEALQSYFEYALQSERQKKFRNVAFAYAMIGWLYQQQGSYTKAYEFYGKSLDVALANRDRLNESIALRKLAVWHMDSDQNDRALELLTKSSQINRERMHLFAHRYNLACDYFDMGLVFTNKGDLTAAKEFYVKSMELFRRMRRTQELSDYYFNLGEILVQEKEYGRALDAYMRGLDIDRKHDHKPSLIVDYSMIAELYMEMDNYKKADEFLHLALKVSQEIGARPEMAGVYYDLGMLYKKKGLKHRARDYLRLAQEIYKSGDYPESHEVKKEIMDLFASTGPAGQ